MVNVFRYHGECLCFYGNCLLVIVHIIIHDIIPVYVTHRSDREVTDVWRLGTFVFKKLNGL